MVFSSYIFVFYFLPAVLAGYYLIPIKGRGLYLRNIFLTIVSYIFYGWHEPWFVVLMWVSTAVDFLAGRIISHEGQTRFWRNFAVVMSCAVNLGMLGFFKYYMFFSGGINRLFTFMGVDGPLLPFIKVGLPIGISFYTFQTMSYTIDVWRGKASPVKSFASFSCFVALFPQLIAGPIVRYSDVAVQLDNRKHGTALFSSGVSLFILGFAKKILLANQAGIIADAVFGADTPTSAAAWWGALAYHFQIYFDFCGYSDMAVGLGRMFGFEFSRNFNAPYHAVSITDFWRRWHISLSTWIRDYLYIPLGGNRKGVRRTYFNLMISFFLCGLWHGAKTTFICWGLFYGFFLIAERLRGKKSLVSGIPRAGTVLFTNVILLFGWVLFRAPDLSHAFRYWRAMTGTISAHKASLLLEADVFGLQHIFAMVLCALFVWQPVQAFNWVDRPSALKYVIIAVLFILSIAAMFTQSFNPFLYFQF